MRNNYFTFFSVLFCSAAFSQSAKVNADQPSQATQPISSAQPISRLISNNNNVPVFERAPLPQQKVSPAIFYIVNDQQVDLQTYRRYQQLLSTKK